MRHFLLFLFAFGLSEPSFATRVECTELLAAEANSALLRKLELGILGEWKLAVPGPDGRPSLVSALRDPGRGKWIFVEDERVALFAQQELQSDGGHRVIRIDVDGPLDRDAMLQIFSQFLTVYEGRLVEVPQVPDLFAHLAQSSPPPGEQPLLIIWTFTPYTEIEGDSSKLWFHSFSSLGTCRGWKQIVVSDDSALLQRLGMNQSSRLTVHWGPPRDP